MSQFGDYLWNLLPRFFKLLQNSEPWKWVSVFGGHLDDTKGSIFALRRAWLVATASGASLDLLGKARGIIRYPGEDDELYRVRIMAAFDIYSAGGTIPGITQALALLGYPDAIVHELFRDGKVIPLHNAAGQYNGLARHQGGIRWAEFKIITGIDDTRPFTKTDLQILMDAIYKMKPAHTMPRALVLATDFQEEMQAQEKTVIRLRESATDAFPYVGLSHNSAVRYGGYFRYDGVRTYGSHLPHSPKASTGAVNLHNTQRDSHQLASKLRLTDTQKAGYIPRTLGFRHNGAAWYGGNPAMLELPKFGAAVRIVDTETLNDQIKYKPVTNLASRFPGEVVVHSGWTRNGSNYGRGRMFDTGAARAAIALRETIPGTYAYGDRINHQGTAYPHNGWSRKPRPYQQAGGHDGTLRHQSYRKYEDRFQQHNGLFFYGGRIRRHDQSFNHGANGLGDELCLVIRRRGVKQEYIAI
jgi:hypothetical protein